MRQSASQQIIGAKAIAHLLGTSERTVRRLYRSGKLPIMKLGGRTSPFRADPEELRRAIGAAVTKT